MPDKPPFSVSTSDEQKPLAEADRTIYQDTRSTEQAAPPQHDGLTASRVPLAQNSSPKGYALMFVVGILQATSSLFYQIAETRYAIPASIALLSSAVFEAVCSLLLLAYTGMLRDTRLSGKQLCQLEVRGLCSAMTVYLANVSFVYIPIGTAFTIFSAVPVMVSVLSAIFLNDKLTFYDVIILLVNIAGVLLVSDPQDIHSGGGTAYGIAAALGAVLTASCGVVMVKVLGNRVHFLHNTMAIALNGLMICVFVTRWDDVMALPSRPTGLTFAAFASLVSFTWQCCMNRGVQLCRPGPALVVKSVSVPCSFILGLVFLRQSFGGRTFFGVVLVLLSVGLIALSQVMKEKDKSKFQRQQLP